MTPTHAEVTRHVHEFTQKHKYSPTFAEISALRGKHSNNAIYGAIKAGLLLLNGKRSLKVTKRGMSALRRDV